MLQIGHCHCGVCSFISNQIDASKQAMWLQCAERIGIAIRRKESCGESLVSEVDG